MVCLGCRCPDAMTVEQLQGLRVSCWSLSDPGISRTTPNLQPELGKYSVWSTGLNSAHPPGTENFSLVATWNRGKELERRYWKWM